MGKSDFCSVFNCSRQRDRVKDSGEACSFYQIPLGKSSKATKRRKLWLKALRRQDFTPTKNSKVCNRHFFSGMAINDPNSVDYIPTLNLGYTKQTKERTTSRSKTTCHWTDEKLANATTQKEKLELLGLAVPQATAFIEVSTCHMLGDYSCDQPEETTSPTDPQQLDHAYSRPSAICPAERVETDEQPAIEEDASAELHRLRLEVMNQKSQLEAALILIDQQKQQLKCQDAEMSTLRKQLEERDVRLKAVSYDPDSFDDDAVQFYLGLKSKSTFDALYEHLHHKAARMRYWRGENVDYDQAKGNTGRKRHLTPKHEFVAVLIRLKLGLFVEDLSARLGISSAHFSRMFTSWIRLLRLELQDMCRFPSRFEVRHFMPVEAKKFSNLRCMIDCTEFFLEAPSSLVSQRQTWSSYKQNNTAKILVACTPDGVLCYISPLYCGGSSDKFITMNCGFLEHLQPGDRVLADKGFDVKSEVEKRGACLNVPPFLHPGHKQFTEDEVEETRQIAEVRIHVERLIGRIKSFHLLDGTMPLTLHPILEDIIHTCAYLTLFQTPICKADCPRPVDGQPVGGSAQESMLG